MRKTRQPTITLFIGDKQVDRIPEDHAKKMDEAMVDVLSKYYPLHPEKFDELSDLLNKR
jgi:hypothetical protein